MCISLECNHLKKAQSTNAQHVQAELTAVRAVSGQLDKFKAEMERDASAQRDALLKVRL
jgi:hypothetical protein